MILDKRLAQFGTGIVQDFIEPAAGTPQSFGKDIDRHFLHDHRCQNHALSVSQILCHSFPKQVFLLLLFESTISGEIGACQLLPGGGAQIDAPITLGVTPQST